VLPADNNVTFGGVVLVFAETQTRVFKLYSDNPPAGLRAIATDTAFRYAVRIRDANRLNNEAEPVADHTKKKSDSLFVLRRMLHTLKIERGRAFISFHIGRLAFIHQASAGEFDQRRIGCVFHKIVKITLQNPARITEPAAVGAESEL